MLNRLIARFRKKPESPSIRVPTFEQIQPRRPRFLIASILAIGGSIASYLACPGTHPRIESPPIQPVAQIPPTTLEPDPPPSNEHAPAAKASPTPAIADEQPTRIVDTRKEKTIYIGPRGGRYHYSASGKKVYERKK